jgi:lipoyl(octanoyl) transferase 2
MGATTARFYTRHDAGSTGMINPPSIYHPLNHLSLNILPPFPHTQHSPVYTIGKRGKESDFIETQPLSPCQQQQSYTIHTIPRGGETTYHGPGQLVCYPILSLRPLSLGARAYVEALEDAMIQVAGAYGISARGRVPGRTGVWVGERKLGAVGVRISRGVTSHGLALNVTGEPMNWFQRIVACGAPDKQATSLETELNRSYSNSDDISIKMATTADILTRSLTSRIGYTHVEQLPDVLDLCEQYNIKLKEEL